MTKTNREEKYYCNLGGCETIFYETREVIKDERWRFLDKNYFVRNSNSNICHDRGVGVSTMKTDLRCKEILKPKLFKIAREELGVYPVISEKQINNGRYAIITYSDPITRRKISFTVIFRNMEFLSYGMIYKGTKEKGETINKDEWEKCIKHTDYIIFFYEDFRCMMAPILLIKKMIDKGNSHIHKNKADGKIEIAFSTIYLNELEWK